MADPVIRAIVSDLANFVVNTAAGGVLTTDQLIGILQTYMASRPPVDIPLTNVSVDYEQNKAEIEAIVASSNAWKDNYTAAVGAALIRIGATILTYDQFSLVRSAQETMLPTAVIDSSIYAGTKHLGVRLARRIPSQMAVTVTRTGDTSSGQTITAYTQFNCAGVRLFNRDDIIFPSGVASIGVLLYEGSVQTTSFVSTGESFLNFELGAGDYTISDIDTVVRVNNLAWTRTQFQQYFNIGLWEYDTNDQVFEDETTPDGNVNITFGNGVQGAIPPAGATITISYVSTNGQEGNVDLTGQTLVANFLNGISGTVTGVGINGTDEQSAATYKTLGPGLFFAKYRATDITSHSAVARRYPGVIDAIFEGQQTLHPSDLRFMMIVRATLLTQTTWLTPDWDAFIAWFQDLGIANIIIQSNTPTAVPVNFSVNVFVRSVSTPLNVIQNKIIANLKAAFTPRAGILGYSRYLSDFEPIISDADPSVDYFDLISPTTDTIAGKYQYITLGTITVNMGYSTRDPIS